jgi:pimeloyl-ACP methyl ester carboxylesterase
MAQRHDSTDLLPDIACPALVIVGSEDTLTPVTEAECLRNGIRGASLRVIDSAGHLSNMERPEEFNSALAEFLDSLK